MNDFALVLKASAALYRDCVVKASVGTLRNWIVVPAAVVMVILFYILAAGLGALGTGILGGFLLGFLMCLCIAQYYSWLSRTRDGERISSRTLLTFDVSMFQAVISAAFILWILDWIVGSLLLGVEGAGWVSELVKLALILIFNPLAEVVYIRGDQDLSAFQRAFQFTRDHWLEWFIPYLIVFSPLLLAGSAATALDILSRTSVLFPAMPVITAFNVTFGHSYVILALAVALAHWLMLFRAELFEALDSGSRRLRIYKYKNS